MQRAADSADATSSDTSISSFAEEVVTQGFTMDKDRSPVSFISRWKRRRAPVFQDDPAGYGTAFGLDLTLSQPAALPDPAAATPLLRALGQGWWSRWWHRQA